MGPPRRRAHQRAPIPAAVIACLAAYLSASVSGCFSGPPRLAECTSDLQCVSGSVCRDNVCAVGCDNNLDCPTGQVCGASGACVALPPGPLTVTIDSVTGNGTTAADVLDALVISGRNLNAVTTARLIPVGGTQAIELTLRAQTATVLEAVLPQAIDAAVSSTAAVQFTLRLIDAAALTTERVVSLARGPLGPQGATGTGVAPDGSQFVAVTAAGAGATVALTAAACASGQSLAVASSATQFACAGVFGVTAGTGVTVTPNGATPGVALNLGTSANTAARGDHVHTGATWTYAGEGSALTLVSTVLAPNIDGAMGVHGSNQAPRTGAADYAGVYGLSTAASNAVGVYGESRSSSDGIGVRGVAQSGAGVFSYSNVPGSKASTHGLASGAGAVGVVASNGSDADGYSLEVRGRADLSQTGVALPVRWVIGGQGGDDPVFARCGPNEVAIGGGCYVNIVSEPPNTFGTLIGVGGHCLSGSHDVGTFNQRAAAIGYCCGSGRAEATCMVIR